MTTTMMGVVEKVPLAAAHDDGRFFFGHRLCVVDVLRCKYTTRWPVWWRALLVGVVDAAALHVCVVLVNALVSCDQDGDFTHHGCPSRVPTWRQNVHHGINALELHGRHLMHWISSHPVGLKLCVPLARLFASTFLYTVQLWTHFLHLLTDAAAWLTTLKMVAAFAHVLGASGSLALGADAVALLAPWHVVSFYGTFRFLYRCQIAVIRSVALIFMGWKYNPLRERVDSCSFTFPELMMGTLVLTIALFCLPTTAVFYLCFCLMLMGVCGLARLLALLAELCVLLFTPSPQPMTSATPATARLTPTAPPSTSAEEQKCGGAEKRDDTVFATNIVLTDTLLPRPPTAVVAAWHKMMQMGMHVAAGRPIPVAPFTLLSSARSET